MTTLNEKQWENLMGSDTRNKILMYNPETGDIKLTRMKMTHPKFEETFTGYEPLGTVHGFDVVCSKLNLNYL